MTYTEEYIVASIWGQHLKEYKESNACNKNDKSAWDWIAMDDIMTAIDLGFLPLNEADITIKNPPIVEHTLANA